MQTKRSNFCFLFFLACSFGCESSEDSSNKRSGGPLSSVNGMNAEGNIEEVNGFKSASSSFQVQNLFQDEIAIKTTDFDFFTACRDLFSSTQDMQNQIVPWPNNLKTKLANELKKFPMQKRIEDSVLGYFLVKGTALASGDKKVAGLMCGTTVGQKGVVFLNETVFLKKTSADEIFLSSNYTLNKNPVDENSWTLIHETMHAIDVFYYADPGTGAFSIKRQAASDLAWNDVQDSKYNDISILTLDGEVRPINIRSCLYEHGSLPFQKSLELTAASPRTEADDLEYLQAKTNFITPYSAANAYEDFADTLTAYYYGTRNGGWPLWSTYDMDISKAKEQEDKLLYTFDAKKVIQTSDAHRKKMCAFATLVFDDNCEKKLP